MVTIKLYVEGAGQNNDLQRTRCRQAFHTFFKNAGVVRNPRVIACGARGKTYEMFCHDVQSAQPDVLPLLLVDAESALSPDHSSWQHLKYHDNWERPAKAKDDQVFLMVQVMETWFLADPAAMYNYFGAGFSEAYFKAWPRLEEIAKEDVYSVLEAATARCKRPYKKKDKSADLSFEILCDLDPSKVEATCPNAKFLLERLRRL
ncbi:MAG: DUF4276 family protein [Caldilineales bacterium]